MSMYAHVNQDLTIPAFCGDDGSALPFSFDFCHTHSLTFAHIRSHSLTFAHMRSHALTFARIRSHTARRTFHSSHSLRGGQRVPHGLGHRFVLPRRVRRPHPEPAQPSSLDGFLSRVGTVSTYQSISEQISTRTYLAL